MPRSRDCDDTLGQIEKGRHVPLDFSDPMAATRLCSKMNRSTFLVNNAGIIRRADSTSISQKADWDDVIDVNLKAVFFTCQAFGKAAIGEGAFGGAIVNIASLLSFQGGIRVPSYTACQTRRGRHHQASCQ